MCSFLMSSCASKKITDISYISKGDLNNPTLNVFKPKGKASKPYDVLIYIYGGGWNSGKKEIYGFFGRNFAKKGIITVIPDYTLSPNASYDVMAQQVAEAIKWTMSNVANYGGNPERIFITGHSAGGHLAALATMSPAYNKGDLDINGIILNDAAALDMHNYLQKNPPKKSNNYVTTWTTNPEEWKKASPIYFINEDTPPIFTYLGTKTYESIKEANKRFRVELLKFQPEAELKVLDKKHIPMIVQYAFPWNKRSLEIKAFMSAH